MRRIVSVSGAAASALTLALMGCHVIQRIGGTDTADLTRATLRRMSVTLRKPEQTVCPREQTQMGVFMTAIPEGGKEERTYETWTGRGAVRKNDLLEFRDFTFQSEQGQFDKDGWFAPLESVQATAGHEFVMHVTYNPSSAVFSNTYKFKPDYACITSSKAVGTSGVAGGPGKDAAAGRYGDGGGVMSSGGDGQDGPTGGVGGDGTNGEPGPKIHAVVTYVKTPFYDKLVGIRLSGAVTDLLLVEPGHPFTLRASGGSGGAGGPGGRGGNGGGGAAGNPGGRGGNGGQGGPGGKGGNGGAGGTIDLVYDSHFPDLANAVTLDVAGQSGAGGGHGGTAGDPGIGGKGLAPANSPSGTKDGGKGRDGLEGVLGPSGHVGANGVATAHAGAIGDSFASLTDIAVLSGTPLPRAAR